jgi:hypothetical protein
VNVGDQVQTPDGPGRIVARRDERTLIFGKPTTWVYFVVEFSSGQRRLYRPDELRRVGAA